MTTTALPTTSLNVIEALDFQPDVACDSRYPEKCGTDVAHSADWYALRHCPGVIALCDQFVETHRAHIASGAHSLLCGVCGARVYPMPPLRVLGPVQS